MTPERETEIREYHRRRAAGMQGARNGKYPHSNGRTRAIHQDITDLLAEVDRLRAELARTQHWLEKFQSAAAAETVRAMRAEAQLEASK